MFEFDFLVIGGGAAGYFAAINAVQNFPNLRIAILEKNREVLQKVKVSGGGRCNVTNSCTNPFELINNYPRGHEFLLEPFKRFGSQKSLTGSKNVEFGLKQRKTEGYFLKVILLKLLLTVFCMNLSL